MHRDFNILAKVADSAPRSPSSASSRPTTRRFCCTTALPSGSGCRNTPNSWSCNCPPPLPLYGHSLEESTKSLFPNVLLIRRHSLAASWRGRSEK